jgi:hypothetical protein
MKCTPATWLNGNPLIGPFSCATAPTTTVIAAGQAGIYCDSSTYLLSAITNANSTPQAMVKTGVDINNAAGQLQITTTSCSAGQFVSSVNARGVGTCSSPSNPSVTITTGTTGTLSTPFTINQEGTTGTAVAYTLPTASAGAQYCVDNGYNGSAADTGALTVNTSTSGQYILFTDGTLSASGGYVVSGGAARDGACFAGIDSTHWIFYPHSPAGGTWTKH